MREPRLLNGQLGHDTLGEHLPKLDAPLVERVDARSPLA